MKCATCSEFCRSGAVRKLFAQKGNIALDCVFYTVMIFYGLELRSKLLVVARTFQIFWLLSFGTFAYDRFKILHLRLFVESPGCVDIAFCVNEFVNLCFCAHLFRLILTQEDEIRKLVLRKQHRDFLSMFVTVCCDVPYLFNLVFHFKRSYRAGFVRFLTAYSTAHSWQTQTAFFLVYMECVSVLLSKQSEISELLSVRTGIDVDRICRKRQSLRKLVRIDNRLFTTALGIVHLKLFTGSIFTIGTALTRDLSDYHKFTMLGGHIGFVAQLSLMAIQSNSFKDTFHEIETRLLLTTPKLRVGHDRSRLMRWLQYEPLTDSLKVGREFDHCRKTFLKYVATCITCIAVMLQFDYNLIRHMTEIASQNADSDAVS